MRLVPDTNIYLAACGNQSFCFDLFLAIIESKQHSLFSSSDLLAELDRKVAELVQKKLIADERSRHMLQFLSSFVAIIEPRVKVDAVKRDPSDNKILECALEAKADVVITMDKDLLKLKTFRGIAIIHPKTFLYMLS